MKKIYFSILIACFYITPANAAIINIDPITNNIIGVSGLNVDGNIYDVSFVEGTCVDLFSGCNEATDFFFQDTTTVRAAFSALLSEVFINSPSGQYDSDPTLTYGCEYYRVCNIYAPIFANETGLNGLVFAFLTNNAIESGDRVTGLLLSAPLSINADYTLYASNVYSQWSVSAVPLPASVWLFASGLFAMIGFKKRAVKKA